MIFIYDIRDTYLISPKSTQFLCIFPQDDIGIKKCETLSGILRSMQTPTQKFKIGFRSSVPRKFFRIRYHFGTIFEAVQSELFRFNFRSPARKS